MKSSVRRPLRHRAGASVALALLASVAAADAPRPQLMNDPLFGLSYDTAQVQFEPSASHGPPKGQRWLLARVQKDGCSYSMDVGLIEVESDSEPPVVHKEPDFGGVYKTCAGKTEVLGVPDNLFSDGAPVDDVLGKALVDDAIQRYGKAWGGKEKFQQALEGHWRPEVLSPPLLQALAAQGLGYRPVQAKGAGWTTQLQLPVSLKLCEGTAPQSGFFVVAQAKPCEAASALVSLRVLAAAAALEPPRLVRSDCKGKVREDDEAVKPWAVCARGDTLDAAARRSDCHGHAVALQLRSRPGSAPDASLDGLLRNLLLHTQIVCDSAPAAPPS